MVQVGFISWLAGVICVSTGGGINNPTIYGNIIHVPAAQYTKFESASVIFVVWRSAVMLDGVILKEFVSRIKNVFLVQ